MDGFNFIQAIGLDFICIADFILARATISLKDAQPVVISRLGILHFWGDSPPTNRWNYGVIVRLMVLSLDLWVIVRIVGNRWIYEKQYRKRAEPSPRATSTIFNINVPQIF